jgi:transposase
MKAIIHNMARIRIPKSGNKTLKREVTDKEVLQFQRTVIDIWVWKRAEIIRLAAVGYNNREIEEITGTNEKNVRLWINRFNTEGFDGLFRRKSDTTRGELTKEQIDELKKDIRKTPMEFGYDAVAWTAKLLWKHIENTFGVRYHRRHIYRLIKRIECKLAKPYVTHKKQSKEEVERFYKQVLPAALKKTKI